MNSAVLSKPIPVSSKSQITLPKRIREIINVLPGQNVILEVKDNNVIIKKAPSYKDYIGNFDFDLSGLDATEYIRQDRDKSKRRDII
jgi:AbrB family looped-hinge helix DNA binding protein